MMDGIEQYEYFFLICIFGEEFLITKICCIQGKAEKMSDKPELMKMRIHHIG